MNLQGDEPFAPPEGIRAVAATLAATTGADMATLAVPIDDAATLFDPNAVKVVRGANGDALYFSRAPVPWQRDRFARDRTGDPAPGALRHIGIYAYRRQALQRFVGLGPSQLETRERLEQLRALEAGMRIDAALVHSVPLGVDTPEDLERARAILSAGS